MPAQKIARFLIHTRDFQKCLLNKKKWRQEGRKKGKERGKERDLKFKN